MFIEAGLLIKQGCTKPFRGRTGTIFLYGYSNQVPCVRQFTGQAFEGGVKNSLEKDSSSLFTSKHLLVECCFVLKLFGQSQGAVQLWFLTATIQISEHVAKQPHTPGYWVLVHGSLVFLQAIASCLYCSRDML